MRKIDSISVVIPMYNEEDCAGDVIAEAIRAASAVTPEIEVIAVDDHSSDGTPGILDKLVHADRRIKVVRNSKRLGLGGALRAGFMSASNSAVIYTDADLPCDMNCIPYAAELMKKKDADIVSAYRDDSDRDNFHRSAYSFVFNGIVALVFNPGIKDINFSFKLFDRVKLNKLGLSSQGSFVNAELFIKAKWSAYKIIQFPVKYSRRMKGISKLDNFGNIICILLEMSRFFLTVLLSGKKLTPQGND